MAVFKCKMCGGMLEVTEGAKICECEYCGSKQTIPSVNEENLRSLFNRANVLRMRGEYDKAADIYEKIIQADETEAEAYWGLVLCKYGVEYVEDPATLKRVPTCHRTSFDAVITSEDYSKAIEYADITQKSIYESEAKAIDEIQKGILNVVSSEEPYDVFICYKEADENGKRTHDSVIANDIYHQLTQEGFKVFYAAITLEDKLGSEYEPYIFAALNSSKVMLAIGTKPEYFNAVWVKNEWSRFMKIMRTDRSRTLIPCYRDMDAYELPEEFAHLQAQDMSKIGFINDIIRGIKKIVVRPEKKETETKTPQVTVQPTVNSIQSDVENLLKRGNMALEDHQWSDASKFFEEVLNKNAEEPRAYRGKLLAEMERVAINSLKSKFQEVSSNSNYKKAVRFGDTELKTVIDQCIEQQRKIDEQQSIIEEQEKERRNELIAKHMKYSTEIQKIEQKYNTEIQKIQQQIDSFEPSVPESTEYQALQKQVVETSKKQKQVTAEYENLRKTIAELEKELRSLGLFHKKEKQAIQQQIEALRVQLNAVSNEKEVIEQEKESLEKKIRTMTVQYQSECEKEKVSYVEPLQKTKNELLEKAENEKSVIKTEMKKNKQLLLSLVKKSDIITFGKYDWIVLDITNDMAFIITEDIIEERAYNEEYEGTTWEDCTLRKYLNGTFYNSFSEEEQLMIAETAVTNPDNSKYGTDGGNDTTDKIFLLSLEEAEEYMTEDERTASSWWWLRSPGNNQLYAAGV